MLETVLTSIMDQFQWLRPHKTKVVLALCGLLFLLGLPLTCDVSHSVSHSPEDEVCVPVELSFVSLTGVSLIKSGMFP